MAKKFVPSTEPLSAEEIQEQTRFRMEKLKALQEFTEKYGAYKKVYTGNKALEEYHRMHRTIDSIFNNLFWF